jgi:hypothetical protein
MTKPPHKLVSAVAAIILSILATAPVQSGPKELALLESYVGSWRGQSVLTGGAEPEAFKCRLTVAKGTSAKINYTGRCSLVNMNLSVTGTIAFDDKNNRYHAVMSSNAGYAGTAVGRRNGNTITFDLAEKQVDRGGNDVQIAAHLVLVNDRINIDFMVEFNDSGEVLTAKVPFSR